MKAPSINGNTIRAKRYFKNNPWARHVLWARERCTNPKSKAWPSHGAKGVKVFLTIKQARLLWERDRAAEMVKPSLDRIESDKHYCEHNCRFLEFHINSQLPHNEELRRQYGPNGGDPSWAHEDVVPF